MHVHDSLPVFRLHFQKALVPQNAGVVDQDIQPAKVGHGCLDDTFSAFGRGNIVIIGHGFSAKGLDLFDNPVCRRGGSVAGPVAGAAQIVDNDLGAPSGQFEGICPPESGPGTGHHRHPALEIQTTCGGNCRPRHRHRFPEVIHKSAFFIDGLAFQSHPDRQPDLDLVQLAIGKIGHHPAAALELNHAVYGGRIDRNRQHVAPKRFDRSRYIGEFIFILGADGAALRIDTDIHAGILRRAALPAFSAHKPQNHLVFTPQHGGRCLGRRLGPDPHFGFDQIAEFEPFLVIVDGLLVPEASPDTVTVFQIENVGGHLEVKGIGTLTETAHQNAVAGPGLLQGRHQHQKRMRRPGFAAYLMHVVHQLFGSSPQPPGNLAMIPFEKTGVDQPVHIIHGDVQFFEEPLDDARDNLTIAHVPGPALLPYIIIPVPGAAVMIDKIYGQGIGALEFRDDILIADRQCCSTITEPHFVEIGRLGFTAVAGGHQDIAAVPAFYRFQRGDQCRGSRFLRGTVIRCYQILPQIQGRRQNSRVLPVRKRLGGGGKVERIELALIHSADAVTGRLDRHRHGILVPVAH